VWKEKKAGLVNVCTCLHFESVHRLLIARVRNTYQSTFVSAIDNEPLGGGIRIKSDRIEKIAIPQYAQSHVSEIGRPDAEHDEVVGQEERVQVCSVYARSLDLCKYMHISIMAGLENPVYWTSVMRY
jgi:hypothetical protein